MSTEQRTQHPFYMHDCILIQPEVFANVVKKNEDVIETFATKVASCNRLFLVGIGTSYHAAQIGEYLVRAYDSSLDTYAYQAFDFALYGPQLKSTDCVIAISHRGNKTYTLNSLNHARELGCYTALITGEDSAASSSNISVDTILHTVAQEKSSAHTISYVGALAVLSSLVRHLGYYRTGLRILQKDFLYEQIPRVLQTILKKENEIALLARQHVKRRRFWLVGGGPSAVTAHEAALKIKETSYLQAEGMSIEAMLHGPFQCSGPEDLFILISPAGKAQARVLELVALVKEIGAEQLIFSDETSKLSQQDLTGACIVPAMPEVFTALTCLIPLQLFAYYLALESGTNPDGFRLEDQRFASARKLVQL